MFNQLILLNVLVAALSW